MTPTNLMLASGILPALQQFVMATKLHPILVNFHRRAGAGVGGDRRGGPFFQK